MHSSIFMLALTLQFQFLFLLHEFYVNLGLIFIILEFNVKSASVKL